MINTQDVIFIKNLTFKDTNTHDLKIAGHPALVIHVTDSYFYFLLLSTHPPKLNNKSADYILKNYTYCHFKFENTHIDLKNIYRQKIPEYWISPVSYIEDHIFEDIMNNFFYYQENVCEDEYFSEVKKAGNSFMLARTRTKKAKQEKSQKRRKRTLDKQ